MTSGAQKFPRLPGTASDVHAGALLNTRGPASQLTRSFECRVRMPRPVEKTQYSYLHLTIVEGSWVQSPPRNSSGDPPLHSVPPHSSSRNIKSVGFMRPS